MFLSPVLTIPLLYIPFRLKNFEEAYIMAKNRDFYKVVFYPI